MSKLVIANFKMNGSRNFIENWIKDFSEKKATKRKTKQ